MTGDSGILPGARMPAPFARTSLPGRVVFGDGALAQLSGELDQRGLKRAMLIAAARDRQLEDRGAAVLGDRLRLRWD
jgi:maleylacetate reductase